MFYIKVLNTILKNDKNENIIFDNLQEKLSYFNIYTNEQDIISNYLPCNVDIKNGINITAIINARQSKENQNILLNYNMYELLNSNYAFIYDSNGEKEFEKFRFYYVDKIYHDTMRNQFICTLALDVIQTYYNYLHFEDCIIERCHLNRFVDNRYNFKRDSYFITSDNNFDNNITIRKDTLNLKQVPDVFELSNNNKYLIDNVKAWVYYFVKVDNQIKPIGIGVDSGDNLERRELTFNGTNDGDCISSIKYEYSTDIICLCAPIYKAKNKLYFDHLVGLSNHKYEFSDNAIKWILSAYNLSANVISVKYSKVSPFYFINKTSSLRNRYDIDFVSDDTLTGKFIGSLAVTETQNTGYILSTIYKDTNNTYFDTYGELCFTIPYGIPQYNIDIYNNYDVITYIGNNYFSNNEIRTDYKYIMNEILCNDLEFIIYGKKFKIPKFVFNNNILKLRYYEVLTPDITYYIIEPYDINIESTIAFINKENNFIQGSTSLFQIYSIEKYSEFVLNNRNFYTLFGINMQRKLFDVTTNAISNLPYDFYMTRGVGTATNLMQSFRNMRFDALYFDKTIENYKYAPDDISGLINGTETNIYYNNLDFYLNYNISPKSTIDKIKYIEKRYGYKYNIFSNIKSQLNRKYYNYIKAQLDNVHIEYLDNKYYLSNELIQELKNIFSNGIALFIHKDFNNGNVQFDYTLNNYEREFDI